MYHINRMARWIRFENLCNPIIFWFVHNLCVILSLFLCVFHSQFHAMQLCVFPYHCPLYLILTMHFPLLSSLTYDSYISICSTMLKGKWIHRGFSPLWRIPNPMNPFVPQVLSRPTKRWTCELYKVWRKVTHNITHSLGWNIGMHSY